MTLGIHRQQLFPAWHAAQLVALAEAGVDPTKVEFADTDLGAARWTDQTEVDWILLIGSLGRPNEMTTVVPVSPASHIPFTMSWAQLSIRTSFDQTFRGYRPTRRQAARMGSASI